MKRKIACFSKYIFLSFLSIFLFLISPAQWYDPEKVNKKAREIYALGYDEAVEGKYKESLAHLAEALKADPKYVDVYLSRAGIYANMRNYKASVADFETGFQMDKLYSETYLLPYSISLAGAGEFIKALEAVTKFLATPKLNEQSIKAGQYRKSVYEFAINYQKKQTADAYVFSPKNLGDSINSIGQEYFPSLTIDGSKMIYTRRENNDEDFYESDFINGKWTRALPLGGKINTNLNEGAQNISQDGNWLIFTGCNYPEGAGSCDLYISYRTKNGRWTEPENMGAINTEFWESSPSLSPDKRDLYFASRRPGGFGGEDIWVSHRAQNGTWSKSENLGSTINTDGNESCPFIHADNQTLYFNSNGHMGYGKTDLFMAKKSISEGWDEPLNLGYPINTIDDEGSLIVSSDGTTSYYASEGGDSRGGLDLYSFQLRNDIKALKTLWVKGKVFDKKTSQGLPSSVELTDINTGKQISRLQTDEDGNYLVTLPVGKDYAFNVNRKGYLFYSDNFSMINNFPDSPLVVNIPLQPIEKGASIVLKNIFFDNKAFALKKESMDELDKVVALLNENPKLGIQINGYTDNVGKPADNLLLSMNRAKSVTAYIQSKGIDAKRLLAKGFGETLPMSSNSTEEGRAQNRRTELTILHN